MQKDKSNKLRIAFFGDMLLRDYDGCMRTIFHILDRCPEDVDILCFSGSLTDIDPDSSVTVPDLTIPMNDSYKTALPFLAKRKLTQALDKFDPHIIHFSNPSSLAKFAIKYAKKNKIKVSAIFHTNFLSYVEFYFRNFKFLVPLGKLLVRRFLNNIYNNCDVLFVPTNIMIAELEEAGVEPEIMQLWQRGIDREIFNPEKKDTDYLQALTGNQHPNVLFASRLVWEKNLQTLIDIYKRAQEKGKTFNLLIAGDGVAMKKLKSEMPNAYFLGNVTQDELARLYATSDVFLFPSISETYGNVVIEAMSCGCPCLIANGGGTLSFVDDGVTGFIVEANDVDAYLSVIDNLVADTSLSSRISEAGIKYSKFLDWDKLTAKFYNYLNNLGRLQ